jgi:nicotinamide-nucleotide amidase
MFNDDIQLLAKSVLDLCNARNLKLSTAESCTGGLIAGLLTDLPGSSSVYERGFVTYSNESKQELLGVQSDSIQQSGAVSALVCEEMARGAISNSLADYSISVTGIAGPGGGTPEKPVGLVYIGICSKKKSSRAFRFQFPGNRQEVRTQVLETALQLLLKELHN